MIDSSEIAFACRNGNQAVVKVKQTFLQGNRLKIRVTNGRRAESVVIL